MMNNEHISISLFRVSSDSKYLDMIFSCPMNYYFTSLQLEVKYYNDSDKKFNSEFFDLSVALFSDSESAEKKHWNVRIPLEKLNIFVPAIYKATIKASEIVEEGEYADEIIDRMVCSDVNYAYKCMLNDLLEEDSCSEISDEAIRKYLLLYGHQSALACGDDEVAERYFKLIGNCFSNCGQKFSNCGCHK